MYRRNRPRILHLYSDWKWTGPADPTIELCAQLKEDGWDVLLACRSPLEGYPQSIAQKAAQRGVETITDLHLNRYLSPRETLEDLVRIGSAVRNRGIGLIHCHLTHDHGLGGWASFVLKRRIPVIRTNHKGVAIRPSVGNRWLLSRWTDGLVEYSHKALQGDRMRFGIPQHKILRVYPSVDCERFDRRYVKRDVRRELGVGRQEVLVGVVARMQRHRRFDVLLRAMALLDDTDPPIRLMILGRGTHRRKVAMEPAKRLGLAQRVLFPGYRSDDYLDYLGALDVKVMLVPGSDGTCRALREAMAMGKPAVVARRGMLPEIVAHGVTGFVIDDTPESLSETLLGLAQNPELRMRMGREARKTAMRRFDPKRQAMQIGAFYETVLACGVRR